MSIAHGFLYSKLHNSFQNVSKWLFFSVFNQVFNENRVIVMLKSAAGEQAGGRQLLVSAQ